MADFTNSCAIIGYPCVNGQTYINPCDCSAYFMCDNTKVIPRPCAEGTMWDNAAKNCLRISGTLCSVQTPWKRCKNVNNYQKMSTLRKMCSGYNSTDFFTENNDDDDDGGGGGGGNAGAVAGGVIGGLLILIIIGIIVFVVMKKTSLPEWFRNKREAYKTHTREQQNEPVEDVYDVIDEKQVGSPKPVDNPGYEKQTKPHGVPYNNTATSGSQGASQAESGNSDNLPYSTLKPNDYHDITRSYSTLRATQDEDDLSRSISINGSEVPVQDTQGYFIGYPSGTVPRQPSPIPPNIGDAEDDGYSLGKAPEPDVEPPPLSNAPEPDVEPRPISRLPSDYFVLQSSA